MTTCTIYTRISLDPLGDQTATPRQQRLCRRFAAERRWTVHAVFEDVDVSAYRRGVHRPGYEQLLRVVAEGRTDVVLVWRLDRLVRRPAEFERFWAACEATDTRVVSVTEPVDTSTAIGLAMVRILVTFAGLESTVRSQRLAARNRDEALRGLPQRGRRKFGYAMGMTAIVESEAALIREAATRVLDGEGLVAIQDDWRARGVRNTVGNPYTHSGLRSLLISPHLAGDRAYLGEVVARGTWEPILTPLTGAMVRNLLAGTIGGTPRRYSTPLLSGRLRCGRCERLMTSGGDRYKCSASHGGCGFVSVSRADVEDWTVRQLLWRLRSHRSGRVRVPPGDEQLIRALDKHSEALRKLNADHYFRGVTSYAEFTMARDELLQRTDAEIHRLAPSWRPAGVPAELTHAQLAAAWPTLTPHARRGVLSLELRDVTVLPHVGSSGYFVPDRLIYNWKHPTPTTVGEPIFVQRRRRNVVWANQPGPVRPRPGLDIAELRAAGRPLDQAEAVVVTGLSAYTLARARKRGHLPGHLAGRRVRYEIADLDLYVARRQSDEAARRERNRQRRSAALAGSGLMTGRQVRARLGISLNKLHRLDRDAQLQPERVHSRLHFYRVADVDRIAADLGR